MAIDQGKINHKWRNWRRRKEMRLEIKTAGQQGFALKWITRYQCRVNGVLDLYPTNHKFHNLKTNERGEFGDAVDCIRTQLKI